MKYLVRYVQKNGARATERAYFPDDKPGDSQAKLQAYATADRRTAPNGF